MAKHTEAAALEYVQEESGYGGLEELAYHILEEAPGTLRGDIQYKKISKALEVPEWVLRRVVRSVAFKNVIRVAAVNTVWTIGDEITHAEKVRDKAIDKEASVDTLTKAREHIAKLQGEPLGGTKGDTVVPIQIVFPTPAPPAQLAAENAGVPTVHIPARAGQLPPRGVREDVVERGRAASKIHGVDVGSELDFYSDEAQDERKFKQVADGNSEAGG